MKRFLTKVLLLTLLCCGILLCVNIFVFGSQFSSSYSAVLLDKLDRLNRIEEPKIILVGHSALAFGIRSDMMEEALGMPVVNLGLHGALGNAAQVDELTARALCEAVAEFEAFAARHIKQPGETENPDQSLE